jgi:hypothetical protein
MYHFLPLLFASSKPRIPGATTETPQLERTGDTYSHTFRIEADVEVKVRCYRSRFGLFEYGIEDQIKRERQLREPEGPSADLTVQERG